MKRYPFTAVVIPAAVFLGGLLLYVSTLSPSVAFGDPSEYTLVPHLWGILHPPGYAFMTLLVHVWQTLVPLGALAYRTNLLAATVAAGIATLVFTTVRTLLPISDSRFQISDSPSRNPGYSFPNLQSAIRNPQSIAPFFAAAILLVSPDFWQHAIHSNAHIVTAAFAAASLFALVRWRASDDDRWLFGFGALAGMGITQHPLTVFGFPAYAAFIIAVRPRILTDWLTWLKLPASAPAGFAIQRLDGGLQTCPERSRRSRREQRSALLKLVAAALLGLAPWLYFPIRASLAPQPLFGPSDMNTLDGFLNLALARGLRVNLFAFGLADQWQRLIVFWSLLRLQYALPVIALAGLGIAWLWRRDWRAGLLLSLHLAANLAFILNTVQDVMAYLLIPFVTIAICAGIGAGLVLRIAYSVISVHTQYAIRNTFGHLVVAAGLFIFPLLGLTQNYPKITLRNNRAADEYVDSLFDYFAGKGRHAVLLSDWEHMTPLWYRQHVEGQALDPADVLPVYVVGSSPTLWIDRIWEHVEVGPIYLLEYRRDVVEAGFRLRAEGPFYRVVPPPAIEPPTLAYTVGERAGPLEWLGYEVQAEGALRPGDRVPILLAFRAPEPVSDVIHPYAKLGPYTYRWTTDSHWLTPWWEAGEIIVERWEVIVPLDAPPGDYPLSVGLSNLITGNDLTWSSGEPLAEIAALTVLPAATPNTPKAELQANFGQRVGLRAAQAWTRDWRAQAPWAEPRPIHPGDSIEIRLEWLSLAAPEDSLTVFVHLLDTGNALWASRDHPPLGGSFPTHLWNPRWLPGQQVTDPYRLVVPPDAPPGDYYLEVGLYGLRSIVRVPNFDSQGNLAGDRFILGGLTVLPVD